MTVSRAEPSAGAGFRPGEACQDRILVPTLILSTLGVAVHIVLQYLIGLTVSSAQIAVLPGMVVIFVVGHLVVTGLDRAALDLVDDVPDSWPTAGPAAGPFGRLRLRESVVTSLVLGSVIAIATCFFLLPGLVIAFFTRYTLLFVLDQGLGPAAAVTASVRLVRRNLTGELAFAAAAFGVIVVGLLTFVVGLYVAVPVVLIAQARRYRAAVPAR